AARRTVRSELVPPPGQHPGCRVGPATPPQVGGRGWLSPGDGLNQDCTPVAARQGGREPDNPVTADSVDQHPAAPLRGGEQPRPVPGQRRYRAYPRPPGGPVYGHWRTPRPDQEDRRPDAEVLRQDVGDNAAARAGGESPEAVHMTPWCRDPREQPA